MNPKNILVTGGAGFIGSNLVKELRRRYPNAHITVLDKFTYAADIRNIPYEQNSKFQILKDNICTINKLHIDYDYIFHLAAESHVDKSIEGPEIFIKTNVLGTQNILELAKRDCTNLKKFVHVSTDEVFGDIKFDEKYRSFDEDTKLNPTSPYAASKAASDLIVLSYQKTYGMPIVVTNCSNNFGPRQDKTKLIPKIIKCLLTGEEFSLYNNGINERDWLWVYDHVDGLVKVAEKGKVGERYCFGTGTTKTNMQVIKMLEEISGKTLNTKHVEDRLAHDDIYRVSPDKAMDLDWMYSGDIKANLRKTYSWYLNNQWALG